MWVSVCASVSPSYSLQALHGSSGLSCQDLPAERLGAGQLLPF